MPRSQGARTSWPSYWMPGQTPTWWPAHRRATPPLARALHLAVQQGVRGTWLAALLAAGVKPHLRDAAGKTALDYARSTNNRAALALLA